MADKIFVRLCETSLSDAPIPNNFNFDSKTTIKELMKNDDFNLKNMDFRKYKELYRRILIGKLINVKTIELNDNTITVQGSHYHELPIDRFRIHDDEASLSSVIIKADKWEGRFKEYDLVSALWPIINPKLFNAVHDEFYNKEVSEHCKFLSASSNGIQGIAQLNPTLINPKYGIGLKQKTLFKTKDALLSNPDSIANNFWLFELTNHGKDIYEKKKGASLFAFIAPRELSEKETEMLKVFEQNDPDFVKGVKEGWSILFFSSGEYVMLPGVVSKENIVSKIPENIKINKPDLTYYNTDGTKLC